MKIPQDMLENSMQHRHAGNGWAVVAAHAEEWCDVILIGKINAGSQIFRVWKKLLTLEPIKENQGTLANPSWVTTDRNVTIHHTSMDKIKEIRDDLASGKRVIKNTRLVNA